MKHRGELNRDGDGTNNSSVYIKPKYASTVIAGGSRGNASAVSP